MLVLAVRFEDIHCAVPVLFEGSARGSSIDGAPVRRQHPPLGHGHSSAREWLRETEPQTSVAS
eukprot:3598316-Alexandrium_andersonii.AAC.1